MGLELDKAFNAHQVKKEKDEGERGWHMLMMSQRTKEGGTGIYRNGFLRIMIEVQLGITKNSNNNKKPSLLPWQAFMLQKRLWTDWNFLKQKMNIFELEAMNYSSVLDMKEYFLIVSEYTTLMFKNW